MLNNAYTECPVISAIKSKNGNTEQGMSEAIAQCAAQLCGAKLYNETESKNIPILYGCATDGVEWQFLRFENDIFL